MSLDKSHDFHHHHHHKQHLEFPNKIKSLPIVISTCYWLSENYQKIKEANFVTKQTCNLAESTLRNSLDLASPLLDKFKSKVDHLDNLACDQLDRIENAFPIVKSKPNEMLNQGKDLISNWTNFAPATTTTNDTNLMDKTKILLSKFLDLAESYVQIELSDEYKKLKLKETSFDSISERARILSVIMYSSLVDKALESFSYCFREIKKFILGFFNLIELYNSIKFNVFNKLKNKLCVTKDKIDLYKEYLDLIKKQFTVQDGRSLEHVNSLEERTKIIVRRNVGNFLTIYRILQAKFDSIKPLIEQNRLVQFTWQIAGDIYHLINKPDGSIVDFLNSLISECSQGISKLEKCIKNVNASLLQWVVPNFDAFGVLEDFDDEVEEYLDSKSVNYEPRSRNSTDLLLMDRFERYRALFYLDSEFLETHFRPIQIYETTSCTPNSKTISSCSTFDSSNDNSF
ncbi:unnamed protein product [Brachionus calyciflorus]|uniref:Perilipin n=1 Tax=Brachionus calyciflorus TaxID=104777 RepID=A0A813WWY0_9BILA|nr:unnamed protein product [Brachionus calyciflorus]